MNNLHPFRIPTASVAEGRRAKADKWDVDAGASDPTLFTYLSHVGKRHRCEARVV